MSDEPSVPPKLKWVVYEVLGAPVYSSMAHAEAALPITDPDPLKFGSAVLVPCLTGYIWATVVDARTAETEANIYGLTYDVDRRCWVSQFSANKKALAQLTLYNTKER